MASYVWWLPLLIAPMVAIGIDTIGAIRARRRRDDDPDQPLWEDFQLLVPIYGDLRYLENVEYLAPYGRRVMLCTTTSQSAEFDAGIDAIAQEHGFRVFRATVTADAGSNGKRATGGTVRDRIVRAAAHHVTAEYAVCIDADTTTTRPISELVGVMRQRDLDVASVRLIPLNTSTWLGKVQAHEYHLAMLLRRVIPWLVSGACHGLRTPVLRDVMDRHSMFFQGNDIEVGVLAQALGYRVGHVQFDVPTMVPDRWSAWVRQRLAWAGGHVRLFLVNPQLGVRHPFFWAYGGIIVLLAFPLRWLSARDAGLVLVAVYVIYVAILWWVLRGRRDPWILLLPFYTAINSMVITPLGFVFYVRMAWADRNAGVIRPRRALAVR